ncbi:MAG: hypothetical protein ABR991_10415, partial [Terracidiphilus sp.]
MRARQNADPALPRWTRSWIGPLLLICLPCIVHGQAASLPAPPAEPQSAAANSTDASPSKPVRNAERRKAAKLYLASGKLFEKEEFEAAMRGYEQAAALDPGNRDYPLAVGVARGHAVTALIQAAAKARMRQDAAAARAALAHAMELDPGNAQVNQHLNELGDDALRGQARPIYAQGESGLGEAVLLLPAPGVRSFHLHTDQREIIRQVFKAYGIDATVDESVRGNQARLDVDDAGFA